MVADPWLLALPIHQQPWYWLWSKYHKTFFFHHYPDSKVHGANMGPIWVLSAPDGPHVGPMNFAIRVRLPNTCAMSVSRNYNKSKCIFMFPEKQFSTSCDTKIIQVMLISLATFPRWRSSTWISEITVWVCPLNKKTRITSTSNGSAESTPQLII